jgi:peptidyl-dipeptidase Dcp
MNLKNIAILLTASIITVSCSESENKTTEDMSNNPFLKQYETPFEVPPFDLIKIEHYKPAFLEAIKLQQAEIDAIANQKEEPTFENTIVALDKSGEVLDKVSSVFYNINGANTNDEIQAIANDIAPIVSNHTSNISLNEALFKRIKTLWDKKEELALAPDQLKLLDDKYKKFVRSGANLDEKGKERLRTIDSELSSLTLKFGQNVLAETNAFQLVIDKKEDLSGLPENIIQSAANVAKEKNMEGKWIFTLQGPSLLPFLTYADNRELRKQIWEAYKNRGFNKNENNNSDAIAKMVALRAERAKLLGYNNHADYVLEERMAMNAENVYKLLNQLWTPALNMAILEADEIKARIKKEGKNFDLKPYDWRYYEEKIRKEKFDLDDQELMPYFSLDNVSNGIFTVCKNLYGLEFKKINDIPVYHPDAVAYEVIDKDNSHLGVLYMDMFARESKRGGAWMTSFREQSVNADGTRKAPVISIVCNFSKPVEGQTALLNFDEVTTYFHEFGHALHGLLSNVRYVSQAGTSVPTDFVELPSQIMENWATEPAIMKMYAKHYQTGEVLPDNLIAKLEKSGTFGQGFTTTEYLAASLLDLDFHAQTSALNQSVEEFEKSSMQKIGLIDEILPRYRSSYFSHIFAGGYSAGYYSYIWSGVLDTDAYQAFKETDLFNQEKAQLFIKEILEKGGTGNPMEMYKKFRGAEPKIDALLKKRGLDKATNLKVNKKMD